MTGTSSNDGAAAFNIALPKWPALLVMGKKVTREQAVEIIFRTNSGWSSNDRHFLKFVADNIGHKTDEYDYMYLNPEMREQWGSLPLEYLGNSRIVSCWIGGPHGWCTWEGDIFTNNYNIGKWPSVQEVFSEWSEIAQAFPFLDLRCQLLDREAGEEIEEGENPATVVVEFIVKDGTCTIVVPESGADPMMPTVFDMSGFLSFATNPNREHITREAFTTYYSQFKALRGF